MPSLCCRERTEHLSSSWGRWRWWGRGAEPHALLCCRTLAPPGWKDASRLGTQTLALVPAAGFHNSLLSPADLCHFHVGQFACFVSVFFLLVSNLLFRLVHMRLIAEKDVVEEIG